MRLVLALILAGASVTGFAQASPKDVSKNHWAYATVDEMFRLGLLVGYPDGNFNGSRPVSRFELAEGLWKLSEEEGNLIKQLGAPTSAHSNQAELERLHHNLNLLHDEMAAFPKRQDIDSIQAAFASLKQKLPALKSFLEELKAQLAKSHP